LDLEILLSDEAHGVLLPTPAKQIEHKSYVAKEKYGTGFLYV
jgi:hypothetical protein